MEKGENILFDLSSIQEKPSCAISIHLYAGRLLQGFKAYSVLHPIALVRRGMEEYIDSLAGFKVDKIIIQGNEKVTFSSKLDRFLGIVPFKKKLQEHNICAVLDCEFSQYIYFYPKKYHQHLVIHDLYPISRSHVKNLFYSSLMFWWANKRIPHVISISQGTREGIKKWCGEDSTVIYNSIPFDFKVEEIPIPEVQEKSYILDVNRIDRHKNAETLIRALFLLKDKIPHNLYFKGYDNKGGVVVNELKELISELGLKDRVIIDTSYRSEGEMRWLYTHADLFVTPSLEEGFGYTPIEAAVLKTPVLVSDIPVLKEVTQGKIESFNPHSPEELAEKISKIISNPPSNEERTALSEFYLKEYSLEKQIERFTEVIMNNISH